MGLGKFKILNKKGYNDADVKKKAQCYVAGIEVKAGDVVELEIQEAGALELVSRGLAAPLTENAKKIFPHAVIKEDKKEEKK